MLVTVGVQQDRCHWQPWKASCPCVACLHVHRTAERNHTLARSGGCSIPTIDTATLNCDQALFLAMFLHVILKSNIIFCGCWELCNDIRPLFLKWITYLPFVIWGVEALRRPQAKTICFESVSVVADSITDNVPMQTGKWIRAKI